MIFMKVWLFLMMIFINIFPCFSLQAQENLEVDSSDRSQINDYHRIMGRPWLYIEKPNIVGIEGLQLQVMTKTAIVVAAETQKYQILFSLSKKTDETGLGYLKLVMEGTQETQGKINTYNLKFSLIQNKSSKLVKQVSKDRVSEKSFQFTVQNLLYELLWGEVKKKRSDLTKNPILELEEKRLDKIIAKIRRDMQLKKNLESLIGKPSVLSQSDSNKKSELLIDENIESEEESEGSEGAPYQAKAKEDEKKKSIFQSPDVNLERKLLSAPPDFEYQNELITHFDMEMTLLNTFTESDALIIGTSDVNQLSLLLSSRHYFEKFKKLNYTGHLRYSKLLTESKFNVQPTQEIGLGLNYHLYHFLQIHGGFEYETQSFVNLGTRGEGLKSWETSILFGFWGLGFKTKVYQFPVFGSLGLYSALMATTAYDQNGINPKELKAQKKVFKLGIDVYADIYINFIYSTETVSTTEGVSLSNLTNSFSMGVGYHF